MTSDRDKHASRFLSLDQLLRLLPIGERTLLRMVSEAQFPAPYRVTPKRRVWKESDILEWERNLPNGPYFKSARSCQHLPPVARRRRKKAGK